MSAIHLGLAVHVILTFPVFGATELEVLHTARRNLEGVASVQEGYHIEPRLDCGARALAAAMLILHRPLDSFAKLQNELLEERGTSLARVEHCARAKGMNTLAVVLSKDQLLQMDKLAILHVKSTPEQDMGDHYVLYAGSNEEGEVRILDPPSFGGFLDASYLETYWDGVALILSLEELSAADLTIHSFSVPVAVVSVSVFLVFALCSSVLWARRTGTAPTTADPFEER